MVISYSCVIHRSSNASQDQEKHLALIEMVCRGTSHGHPGADSYVFQVLGNTNTDQESLYRALVAFGNVVRGIYRSCHHPVSHRVRRRIVGQLKRKAKIGKDDGDLVATFECNI